MGKPTDSEKSDLFALDCSRRYGYLRPTDPADVAQLDRLAAKGWMRKGSGPVTGDARCGFYWVITDEGRIVLGKGAGAAQREG